MSAGKVALITAAGRGMGAAIARELAAAGYRLVLFSPSENSQKLAAELGAIAVQGSVQVDTDLSRLVDVALQHYDRIDVVVNNTGHPPKGDLLAISDTEWHDALDLLILNVARLMRKVTPVMQSQGDGAIVNISSFAAVMPEQAMPVSSSLRAALSAWTRLYAERYARDGIRMNSVLPGFVDSWPSDAAIVARIQAGRYGMTTEIARMVRFLLSEDAAYINGQNILVDGGLVKTV